MRRLSKWLLLGTGGLTVPLLPILLLVVAILALLSSESGSRWLVNRALTLVPVEIRVDVVGGTLMQGLSLRELVVDTEAMTLRIASVDSAWHLRTLLTGRLVLNRLDAEDVDLTLRPVAEPEPKAPGPWPSLSLGIPLVIREVQVNRVRVRQPDTELLIPQIRLAASQGPLNTRIDELFVELDGHQLALSGRIRNRPPYDMNVGAELRSSLPPYAEVIEGTVIIEGGLDAPVVQVNATLPWTVALNAELATGFNADSTVLDPNQIRANARLAWQQLAVPPALVALPVTSSGSLDIEGSVDSYRVSGLLDVLAEGYPGADVELALTGGGTGIVVDNLAVKTEMGGAVAAGALDWQPRLAWDFAVELDRLNPATLHPDWPGEISGHLGTRGHIAEQSLLVNLDIERLSGHLRQYPLLASGSASYDGTMVSSPGLQLSIEQNRLAFDGKLALSPEQQADRIKPTGRSEMDFNWQIDAENLAALLPELGGQLQSSGVARGTFENPVVRTTIRAEKVRYSDYRVDELVLSLVPFPDKSGSVDLSVRAQGLTVPGLQKARLAFDWRGNLLDHAMDLELDAETLAARLTAAGAWQNQQWQGQLQRLELEEPRAGYWHLLEATTLAVAAQSLALSGFCLEQQVQREPRQPLAAGQEAAKPEPGDADTVRTFNRGRLCSQVDWSEQKGINASGQLSELDLALIEPWLPITTSVTGTLSGEFQVQGLPAELTGRFSLLGSPGEFVHQRTVKEVDRYPFGGLQIEGQGSLEQWLTSLKFDLPGDGKLSGNLDYGIKSGDVHGELALDFASLEWFEIFLPHLDDITGTFAADIAINGKISSPAIGGTVKLDSFGALVPDLGIQLQQGSVEVSRQEAEPWQMAAALQSGKGQLRASGSLDWNWQSPWQAQLSLVGERFQLADLPDMSAEANPNLDLRADPQKLSLTGEVKIPKANVVLKKLPESAVSVSGDTIIIEEESRVAVAGQADAYGIYTNVRLLLGDDVHFSGFGISSGLTGSLNAVERPGKPTRIDGEVTVVEGTYKAYGQTLEIEEGRLLFRGSPDNPGLSLRAVRYYEDTKVGIIIGGTARELRSEVFSEPALPTSEAMAILLTGKPLERASKSEATKLSDAVAALGISQSKYVTQRLQSTLGVDVLKLNSGETVEESSLIVGKYLSPRLYVSYVKDLFNPGALVNLEYKMGRRFKLKAEAGAHQSIDLLYSIDR